MNNKIFFTLIMAFVPMIVNAMEQTIASIQNKLPSIKKDSTIPPRAARDKDGWMVWYSSNGRVWKGGRLSSDTPNDDWWVLKSSEGKEWKGGRVSSASEGQKPCNS